MLAKVQWRPVKEWLFLKYAILNNIYVCGYFNVFFFVASL